MIWTVFVIWVAVIYGLTGTAMILVAWIVVPLEQTGLWRTLFAISLLSFLVAAAALRGSGIALP